MIKSQKIIKAIYFSFLSLVFLFSLISFLVTQISNIVDLTGINKTYEVLICVFVSLTYLFSASISIFGLITSFKENEINNKIINISVLSFLIRDFLLLITYFFSFGFTFHQMHVNTLDTKGILLSMLLIYDIVFLFISLFINYNLSKKGKAFIITISMVFSLFTSFTFILGHASELSPLDTIQQILNIISFAITIIFVHLYKFNKKSE